MQFIRVGALALALVTAICGPTLAEWQYPTLNNTDIPGSDYQSFQVVPAQNSIAGDLVASRCRDACINDPKCKGWTAVKPGLQAKNGVCYLKTHGLHARRFTNNCCTSGYKVNVISGKGSAKTTTAGAPALNSNILTFAQQALNRCVDRAGNVRGSQCPPLPQGATGDGECTHLVRKALSQAGARFNEGSYQWGTRISSGYQPGDVIQLTNVRLVGPNGWWETGTQHSAIIERVEGNVLHVIEQNTWQGSTNRRYVTRGTINLGWKLERGSYDVYRPTS